MVYLRFLVSSQPFFIFSGCLLSIIKLEGSSESIFSMNRVRCCTSFTNLARCSLNWKNGRPKTKYALEREAVARPGQRIRANIFIAKLGLGLNFAGNVDFWVCNEDFNKKN